MPHTLIGLISYLALLALSVASAALGRGAIRWSGVILVVGMVLYPLFQDRHVWSNPYTPLLVIEVVETVWFLGAALYDRGWPLVAAAAFQLLYVATMASHLYVRLLVGPFVYISLLQIWTWGHYASVFTGMLVQRRGYAGALAPAAR